LEKFYKTNKDYITYEVYILAKQILPESVDKEFKERRKAEM